MRTAALALLAVIVVLQLAYFAAHAIVVNEPAVAWASAARLPDIASFAVYVVWFRRANRSLRDRGYDLEYGPNAWAWNLVPGANLVMPYLALRDIYQRAVLDVGFWLPLWWGGKLTASLLNWFGASALQPTLVSWVQLALFAASEAMLLIVVFRATHGLSNPPEPVELAPVGKVESESAFATFL